MLFICIAFASLKYLWDVQKKSLLNYFPHRTWRRTHSDSFICTPWTVKQSSNKNLRETIGVLPALDSAIGSGFYKLLSVFTKLYAPHIPIFYITTSAITETTIKQRSFAFICLALTLRSALFLAQLLTHASPSLFHILTSFVPTSPITLLNSNT